MPRGGLRLPAGDVVRDVVRCELDDAEPLRDGQGADGGDDLLEGHATQDATGDGTDASRGGSQLTTPQFKMVAHPTKISTSALGVVLTVEQVIPISSTCPWAL